MHAPVCWVNDYSALSMDIVGIPRGVGMAIQHVDKSNLLLYHKRLSATFDLIPGGCLILHKPDKETAKLKAAPNFDVGSFSSLSSHFVMISGLVHVLSWMTIVHYVQSATGYIFFL